MCTEPSIWPSHSAGLIARPTSCAATIFSTRPSLSRMQSWVAKPKAVWVLIFSAGWPGAVVSSISTSPA